MNSIEYLKKYIIDEKNNINKRLNDARRDLNSAKFGIEIQQVGEKILKLGENLVVLEKIEKQIIYSKLFQKK